VNSAGERSIVPCVLIVDDDPLVLHALETTVRSAGYRVVATIDPLVGLECLREQSVAVIIADQRMDPMSGLELLGHARSLQPHAARILITGLLSVKTLTEAVNCGEIYRFIAKPWSTPELISTVHNAVHRYKLLVENTALQAETQNLNAELLSEKRALEAQLAHLAQEKTELERLLDGARLARGGTFEFCDAVLSAFDGALAGRTRRTVEICRQLAEAAGLPAELRDDVIAIAWFHDLGLIAMSRESDHEGSHDAGHAVPRDHPAISERLALAAGLGQALATAVRAHHESFDGGGFPDRLRGRQIPEITRWLTPVAYFVSCGLNRQRALEEIERLSGVAFDPHVVPYLLRIALRLPSPDAVASPAPPPAHHHAVFHRGNAQAGQQLRAP
jgi:response regulator RpfG family c-di-GMP phosphodiesterase